MTDILNLKMDENDAEAETVGEYLKALLLTLWDEKESFDGKRPFGNSGWEYELYRPLLSAALVTGELDEDGDLLDVDDVAADELIREAIERLCGGKK